MGDWTDNEHHVITTHRELDEVFTSRACFPTLPLSHPQDLLILRARGSRVVRFPALLTRPEVAALAVPTSWRKTATAGHLCAQVFGAGLAGTVCATRILHLN